MQNPHTIAAKCEATSTALNFSETASATLWLARSAIASSFQEEPPPQILQPAAQQLLKQILEAAHRHHAPFGKGDH